MITAEEGLKKYLNAVLVQLEGIEEKKKKIKFLQIGKPQRNLLLNKFFSIDWLMKKLVQKLVLVLTDVDTNEVLERWTFNIETDESVNEST